MEKAPTPTQERWILISLMIGTLMASLDSSIVNVSLPTMMHSLSADLDQIEWVVSAYMIGFAIVMPLTQWFKDRIGFFSLYFWSLALFTLGSLFCGLAKTLPIMIGARVIQALGGGALTPTAMAYLTSVFPIERRGRVMGLWGLGVVIGPALGPTIGGILTEYFGWPSIFLVNLPIGLVGLVLVWKFLKPLPESPRREVSFDGLGFLLITAFLLSFLYGISSMEREGFFSVHSLGCTALAVFTLCLFLFVEPKQKVPLIDLSVFKRKAFVACILVTFTRSAALVGGVFLLPFLLQNLLGFSEVQSGLLMLPGSALVAMLMPFAGQWSDKNGPRLISLVGLVIVAVSMLGFAGVSFLSLGVYAVLIAMVLRGVGLGFLVTPISVATVSSVPPTEVALASSISSLFQQVGGAFGVAMMATLHQFIKNGHVAAGDQLAHAESQALFVSFIAVAVLVLLALIPASRIPKMTAKLEHAEAVAMEVG